MCVCVRAYVCVRERDRERGDKEAHQSYLEVIKSQVKSWFTVLDTPQLVANTTNNWSIKMCHYFTWPTVSYHILRATVANESVNHNFVCNNLKCLCTVETALSVLL